MIKSMTGYGVGTAENEDVKYTVEIKSLNSKFLDLGVRLPKTVSDKELQLRSECSKRIERGKVTLGINVEYTDPSADAAEINHALFKKYYNELKSLADNVGDTKASLFSLAIDMPQVVGHKEEATSETEAALLFRAFDMALLQFDTFRQDEGQVLKTDLAARVQSILQLLDKVEGLEHNRIPLIRERIRHYVDQTVGKENVDMNRFEQELVFYIDKLDITEEKVRLRSHCNYFVQALEAVDSNGKKLGFISQEIGREINTLGSKANHAEIQQIVVGMKEELEKIKEQLLNIL